MYTTNSPSRALKQVFEPAPSHETALSSVTTELLNPEHQPEILTFLAARPLHTVIMAGHIRDNGLVSVLNRGTFHAYRGEHGSLEGVALIGHATLMETRSDAAVHAFAQVAQDTPGIHLVMAEEEKANLFWAHYSQAGQRPRVLSRESLLEQRWPVGVDEVVNELRMATIDDLEAVMLVQAEMALAEGGVNPMEVDLAGFRRRCARRIDLGRTWVWRVGQNLIFKVDIMSDTPEAIYLEGVWVNPRERGKHYGLRCLSQVGRKLLRRTGSICVFANENNSQAHSFYRRAGFKPRGWYKLAYLKSQPKVQEA